MKTEFFSNCFLVAIWLRWRLRGSYILYIKPTLKMPFGHTIVIKGTRTFQFLPIRFNEPFWKEIFFTGRIYVRRINKLNRRKRLKGIKII